MKRWVVLMVATRFATSRVKQRVARSALAGHPKICTKTFPTDVVGPIILSSKSVKSVRLAFWMLLAVTRLEHMIALLDLKTIRPAGLPPRSNGVAHEWEWHAPLTVTRVFRIGVRVGPKQSVSGAASMPSAAAQPPPQPYLNLMIARPDSSIGSRDGQMPRKCGVAKNIAAGAAPLRTHQLWLW